MIKRLLQTLLSLAEGSCRSRDEEMARKGMELERRKREYREYLESYYAGCMPPPSVREGYRDIEMEVLGYTLRH
jgi:hypothetical protein